MWAFLVMAAATQTLGVLRVREDTPVFFAEPHSDARPSSYDESFVRTGATYRSPARDVAAALVTELRAAVASSDHDAFEPADLGLGSSDFSAQRDVFIAEVEPRFIEMAKERDRLLDEDHYPPMPAYSRAELEAVLTPRFVAETLYLDCWSCVEQLRVSMTGTNGFDIESVLPKSSTWRVTQGGRSWTTSSSRLLLAMVALLPSDNHLRRKLDRSRWPKTMADEHGVARVFAAVELGRAAARWRTIGGHDALFAALRLKDASFEYAGKVLCGSFESATGDHFCGVGWDVPMNLEPDVEDMLSRRTRIERQLLRVKWFRSGKWKASAIFGRIHDVDRARWHEMHMRGEPDAEVYIGRDRFMGADVWLLVGPDDVNMLEERRFANGAMLHDQPTVVRDVDGALRLEEP